MAKKEADAAKQQQKRLAAEVKKAKKLEKDVREALEEAGYELISFPSNEYRREFMEKHGYNPDAVFLATLQAAELDEGWRDKIVAPPGKGADKE